MAIALLNELWKASRPRKYCEMHVSEARDKRSTTFWRNCWAPSVDRSLACNRAFYQIAWFNPRLRNAHRIVSRAFFWTKVGFFVCFKLCWILFVRCHRILAILMMRKKADKPTCEGPFASGQRARLSANPSLFLSIRRFFGNLTLVLELTFNNTVLNRCPVWPQCTSR